VRIGQALVFAEGTDDSHWPKNMEEAEEGRKVLSEDFQENGREENGISNRRFSSTFIPPLTASAEGK